MHRNSQNNDYRSFPYLPLSNSRSSRNTHYQYYDPHLRIQQPRFSNTTPIATHTLPHFYQQHRISRTISDLAEPISVFDDIKFPRRRQSNLISFPPVYIPPNLSRRISLSDARLARASAARERLSNEIQHNIREIDRELSLLELRPSIPRLSSIAVKRQTPIDKKTYSSSDDNRMWLNKQKRFYEVIPRITSQTKTVSKYSTPQLTQRTVSHSYIGQYHYGPEVEESEITENDPENSDQKSTIDEISESNSHETFSPDQFRREQSSLPQNRALIFVPEYGNNYETVEDLDETDPIETDSALLSTVIPSYHSGSENKLNIQDFKLLFRTAPEHKIKIPSSIAVKPDEISDENETDLINTILSTPVKHSRTSTRTQETSSSSQQTIINTNNNTPIHVSYFFSDFGNEGAGEEDLISIDPIHFAFTNEIDIVSDDNISNNLIRQSQTSLLNPHSSQEQQQHLTIQNNNEQIKETERKKIDATTKDIISSTSTLPSQNIFPISIYDNMQTQFARNNSNLNQNQRETSTSNLNMKTIKESPENEPNNFSIDLHSSSSTSAQKIPSKTMNSSQIQPSKNLFRDQSINFYDIPRTSIKQTEQILSNKQQTSVESRSNSALPVPLNSPDFNDIRPSTSRSATPERRKSISTIDQNILLTAIDPITFDDPSTERNFRSPLFTETKTSEHDDLRLPSISPRHSDASDANITSVGREDTYRQTTFPDHNNNELEKPSSPIEEQFPLITASQRRSKLSLIVRPPIPKERTYINNQLPQKHKLDFSSINKDRKLNQQHHVLLPNQISQSRIGEHSPLKDWRERINSILERKRFPHDKYAHIKSRVNSFANFDHQPKKITSFPKNISRAKRSSKQQIPLIQESTPRIFGRIQCSSDGIPKIFHESLNWNVESKVRAYILDNVRSKTRQNIAKFSDKKPKWHSESRLSELKKDTKPHRKILTQTISLQTIPDIDELNFHHQESDIEKKIFDINSNGQQSLTKFQESFLSTASFNSKRSDKTIFDEKLEWIKESKLKELIWKNINYQPEKSRVNMFFQPRIQITHSLTWDIQAKVQYWSKFDLHQLKENKALFSQYHNLKWNDLITDNNYPLLSLTQDYIEENFNDQLEKESPANRPKWNSVSKTRSVNSVYNPKILQSNSIRRVWDIELRQKRVHKLPPLKRKRDLDEIPQLAIEGPPSNDPLAVDYNYDHSLPVHDRRPSIDYATASSRRSSRALFPFRRLPDIQLLSETPRSQRPVQQEWYDELSKSRSTHRTNMGRTRNNSIQESIGSIHHTNSPRELLTLRSSTRNSQNSVVSGTLLDPSIRTNRATELRLSRDMEEHHHHSHSPHQSMPIEIRGFQLNGTQLTVPDNATIRPLSNVNYRTSERVKTRRIYPWSNLHQNGTSSRNSSLLPITESRRPSLEMSVVEVPQLIHEE